MNLSFSDLLTNLGLNPSSLVDLGEDVREEILVNFMNFEGGKAISFPICWSSKNLNGKFFPDFVTEQFKTVFCK